MSGKACQPPAFCPDPVLSLASCRPPASPLPLLVVGHSWVLGWRLFMHSPCEGQLLH